MSSTTLPLHGHKHLRYIPTMYDDPIYLPIDLRRSLSMSSSSAVLSDITLTVTCKDGVSCHFVLLLCTSDHEFLHRVITHDFFFHGTPKCSFQKYADCTLYAPPGSFMLLSASPSGFSDEGYIDIDVDWLLNAPFVP